MVLNRRPARLCSLLCDDFGLRLASSEMGSEPGEKGPGTLLCLRIRSISRYSKYEGDKGLN